MPPGKRRIGDMLIARGLINAEQLEEALDLQRLTPGPLGSILAQLGYIDEGALLGALSDEFGVRPWDLRLRPPDVVAANVLPPDIARSYSVLPVSMNGDTLLLAMTSPDDVDALDMVRYSTRMKVEPVVVVRQRLLQAVRDVYGDPGKPAVRTPVTAPIPDTAPRKPVISTGDPQKSSASVVDVVNQLLIESLRSGATSLHIEPHRDRVELRYRIDGRMKILRDLPVGLIHAIAIRLKLMAEIDISDTHEAVSGKIVVPQGDGLAHLHFSMVPSVDGPRMVIHLPGRPSRLMGLEELGFANRDLGLLRMFAKRPNGLVIVTGPPGSGKSTTLCACLDSIRDPSLNVISCDTRFVCDIHNVSIASLDVPAPSEVENWISAILTQEPDVLMPGEINEPALAKLSVQAALSGRLVFAGMRGTDAPNAIALLQELGADPKSIASCLIALTSQRLIRTLCRKCRSRRPITDLEKQIFELNGIPAPAELPEPIGCLECTHSGYSGRRAIHEVLPISPDLSSLIARGSTAVEIRHAAAEEGYISLQRRALELVLEDGTSMEEARRTVALDPPFAAFTG